MDASEFPLRDDDTGQATRVTGISISSDCVSELLEVLKKHAKKRVVNGIETVDASDALAAIGILAVTIMFSIAPSVREQTLDGLFEAVKARIAQGAPTDVMFVAEAQPTDTDRPT